MARSRRSAQAQARRSTSDTSARTSRGRARWALIIVAIAAVAGAAWWQFLRPRPAGPFILISIDTLRADHLAAYGYTKGRTPNIDALARDGVVFDRGYAHAPQTLPSHTSMLTGELPFEHGVRDNIGFTVKPGTTTMASLFKSQGYGTGGFVSAYVLRPDTGINQGFDVYNAELPAGGMDRPIAQVTRSASETVRAAIGWLNTHVDPKVFLFVHMYEPHLPYEPPAAFKDLAPYDGEIAAADAGVGTLLAELRRRGWYDNATIALVADHGEGLGDHGEDEHGLFVYESTIHVPFIVKLPGSAHAGTRVAAPVQHIDLLPTFGRLAGFAAPAGLRGRDLGPALAGGAIPPAGIYSEAMMSRYHFGWSELTSLTDERYKFIRAPKPELYDLQNDRAETNNLVAANAAVAQAMRGGLETLIAGRAAEAPGAVSAEDRQRLAALGYVGTATISAETEGLTLPDPKDRADIHRAFVQAAHAIGALKFPEAADQLRWITSRDPGMIDAWNQYAQVLVRLGRDADAFAAYQEILKRQPGSAPALLDAATVLMRLRRYDEARAHAQAAVSGEPVTAHQLLAKIELAAGHQDAALAEARAAEAADPSLPMTDMVQGMILHAEAQRDPAKFAAALPFFERAAAKIQGRTVQLNDLFYYLGDCLAQVGRIEDAERAFRQEIALFPNLVRARTGLAMLYEATGNSPAADRVITDMLNAVPTPSTYASAADLLRVFGHTDRSAEIAAAARARFGGR
jgi:arylsulfatase A-like enzyme/tetratricopeptide (TPR) repeat protein